MKEPRCVIGSFCNYPKLENPFDNDKDHWDYYTLIPAELEERGPEEEFYYQQSVAIYKFIVKLNRQIRHAQQRHDQLFLRSFNTNAPIFKPDEFIN